MIGWSTSKAMAAFLESLPLLGGPPLWETLFAGRETDQVWKVSLFVSTFHSWNGRCCDFAIYGRQHWGFGRTRISFSKFRDCTDLGISSSAQYISFTVGRPASGRLLCCLLGWFFAPNLWIKMIRSSSRTLGEEFLFFPLGNVRNAYNKKSSKIDFIILYSLAPEMLSDTDFLCRTCHEVG